MVRAVTARTRAPAPAAAAAVALSLGALVACEQIQNAIVPPSMAKLYPQPVTPLATPTWTMKAAHGDADASYPTDFGATVKGDGTILFPEHVSGRVHGATIVVGGDTVLTVGDDGTVKGVGLKRRYKFGDDGALLDEDGHGVRILPDGRVRAIGGPWRYPAVVVWTVEGGGDWDKSAWRTLEIVSLILVENMAPAALRSADGGSPAGSGTGKDRGPGT
jgi:hypothetical protein